MRMFIQVVEKLKVWFPHCNFIIGGDLNGDFVKMFRLEGQLQ